jgi:hypothetical protein
VKLAKQSHLQGNQQSGLGGGPPGGDGKDDKSKKVRRASASTIEDDIPRKFQSC